MRKLIIVLSCLVSIGSCKKGDYPRPNIEQIDTTHSVKIDSLDPERCLGMWYCDTPGIGQESWRKVVKVSDNYYRCQWRRFDDSSTVTYTGSIYRNKDSVYSVNSLTTWYGAGNTSTGRLVLVFKDSSGVLTCKEYGEFWINEYDTSAPGYIRYPTKIFRKVY